MQFKKKRSEAKVRPHEEIIRELYNLSIDEDKRRREIHRELKYYNEGIPFDLRYGKLLGNVEQAVIYIIVYFAWPGCLIAAIIKIIYIILTKSPA